MIILTIGDLHFRLSSLPHYQYLEDEVVRVCGDLMPDVIILMGDVFDDVDGVRRPVWDTGVKFVKKMTQMARSVYCLVGNHDMDSASSFSTNCHFLNSFNDIGVKVIDRPQIVHLCGDQDYPVVMSNYMPPGRFREWFDANVNHPVLAAFTHQEFKGSVLGAIKSEHGDEWPEHYPVAFNGHIHDFAILQKNIINVGTPVYTGYGEAGARSLTSANITESNIHLQRHMLSMPRKRTIKCDTKVSDTIVTHPADTVRLVIQDSEDAITVFKKSNQYEKLKKQDNIKIVFKPVVTRHIKKNVNSLRFDQILADKATVEGVLDFHTEMYNAYSTQKL